MKRILLSAALGALVGTGMLAAQEPRMQDTTPSKTGWWVRVDTQKTESNSVTLQIGTKSSDRRAWRVWHSGDYFEFDVPRDYQAVKEIYLQASANPAGKTTRFCLFYQNVGMKKFEFSGDKEDQVKQSDRDDSCKIQDKIDRK